jgi:hypothetical protein
VSGHPGLPAFPDDIPAAMRSRRPPQHGKERVRARRLIGERHVAGNTRRAVGSRIGRKPLDDRAVAHVLRWTARTARATSVAIAPNDTPRISLPEYNTVPAGLLAKASNCETRFLSASIVWMLESCLAAFSRFSMAIPPKSSQLSLRLSTM